MYIIYMQYFTTSKKLKKYWTKYRLVSKQKRKTSISISIFLNVSVKIINDVPIYHMYLYKV